MCRINPKADEQIKKAIENLDIMHLSGKEREYYENDLKKMLIDQDTLQTAKLKGIQQGELNIARRLLDQGHSIEDVVKMTGLSVAEISKLRN